MYVDGIARTFTGSVISRLEMYTVKSLRPASAAPPVEERFQSLNLIMPTRVLAEFCRAFLSGLQSSESAIRAQAQQEVEIILASDKSERKS